VLVVVGRGLLAANKTATLEQVPCARHAPPLERPFGRCFACPFSKNCRYGKVELLVS
jgi:hypothetical protein